MKLGMKVVVISAVAGLLIAAVLVSLVFEWIPQIVGLIAVPLIFAVTLVFAIPILLQMQKNLASLRCPGCGMPVGSLELQAGKPARYCPQCGAKLPDGVVTR
jgi:hypothetical protein